MTLLAGGKNRLHRLRQEVAIDVGEKPRRPGFRGGLQHVGSRLGAQLLDLRRPQRRFRKLHARSLRPGARDRPQRVAKEGAALADGSLEQPLRERRRHQRADRISPKKMMVTGAAVTGLAWFALSRATSFTEFLAINGLFGICVGASTTIPCSLVIANWFEQRRGLAMGIAFSGGTLGGAAMTIVANYAIELGGWRVGYATLAVPIIFVVVPLILFFVRTRNAAETGDGVEGREEAQPGEQSVARTFDLPGLEVSQATRTRSFWLICAAQLLGGLTLGIGPHFVAYLTGIGYTPTLAATVVSLFFIMITAGTLLGGPLADRFSARWGMVATYILSSLGILGLMEASHPIALAINILAGGFAAGALAMQMPLVMIESLGLKRLGSMMGLTGIFFTFGAAVGPIATGRIFDATGSYGIAIASFFAMVLMCAVAIFGCRPLDREQGRVAAFAPPLAL